MKALVLNGAMREDNSLNSIYEVILAELLDFGYKVDSFLLCDMEIAYCTGCFGCWLKTPGLCKINDGINDIVMAAVKSDLMIFLTPLTFGGYSSVLKKAVDRLGILLLQPHFIKIQAGFHHKMRYGLPHSFIAIGAAQQIDYKSERIFESLVKRNALNLNIQDCEVSLILRNQDLKITKEAIRQLLKKIG